MSKAGTKATRLLQIEALLLDHPEGLTQAEIARRLGVHRSTINRYIPDLPGHVYFDDLDGGKWKIDREAYLIRVRLSLHEAMAVHLASRLLATRMDRQNPHAAASLRKLGLSLERIAPRISRHLGLSADVMDDDSQRRDSVFLGVLEKLTLAWAEDRRVKVWHRHEKSGEVFDYLFSPYFIEPYAVGQSLHVIGYREPPGAVRTFKIERIERVVLLREHYSIPADFDPRVLLADAWGIWYTESEPVEVVLRFHPRVANRVRETRWHRSQMIDEQEDGSLIWRTKVAEPQEMLPWLRGWGADCEVLEPDKLRKDLTNEAIRLSNLYLQNAIPKPPAYFYLWAKTDRATGQWHPLIYHLIDVGKVALELWQNTLTESTRQQFADWLGLDTHRAGRMLAFWISVHDIGKASPAFQDHPYLPKSIKSHLLNSLYEAGLTFPVRGAESRSRHEVISTWALKSLLVEELLMEKRDANRVAHALGGHHGAWPTTDLLGPAQLKSDDKGDESWDLIRQSLVQELMKVFRPPEHITLPDDQYAENALLTLFSGLTTVADWLGSMEKYFPYTESYMPILDYANQSAQYAREALEKLGWLGWQPSVEKLSFIEMFPDITAPYAVQQDFIETTSDLSPPALVILEAPTGSGKTESALYLADRWLQMSEGAGMYIAMPTQATSNQMFGRFIQFLQTRYPDQWVNVHLVHGQAQFSEKLKDIELTEIAADRNRDENGKVSAMTWFLPRKRTLLAEFGVGTVDQALMSVLQTKHFFVRLFGLSRKVVIFDEVHAYDTYMSTLFQRLLGWLRAIGASVIVLTATLPEKTRHDLVQAYLGKSRVELPAADYPRLTVAAPEGVSSTPLPSPPERRLALEWISWETGGIVRLLETELQDGGCAAVICNRVARAQEIYMAISEANILEKENLILFHAQFPFVWRDEIERRVLDRFGKDSVRPHKSIVVATQVIEQSLDLDFDLMVTDLPPIDLLLQRAGRLHRHSKRDISRPARLGDPRLVITSPVETNGAPDFRGDEYVYDEYILLQTWRVLSGKNELTTPRDTSSLIESVYGDPLVDDSVETGLAEALEKSWREMQDQHRGDEVKARTRLIGTPSYEGLLYQSNLGLDEEDPTIHQAFRAMTRLIEPGVPLVCLHNTPAGIALEPDGRGAPLNLDTKPSPALTEELVKRTVTLRRWAVLKYFRSKAPPKAWSEAAALRYHHLAVFEGGICPLEGTDIVLLLNRGTGLRIVTGDDRI